MAGIDDLADASEIAHYEAQLQRYLDLEVDADRFTAIRLQMGVYGQRQEGVNMVRIKLPGGRLDPEKLRAIADALDRHARTEHAHITTRQDIQLHYVPLAETPAVLRRLAQAGLTTREACGNTVRNITTCPLAGVCPREHTDVTAHLRSAVAHFLRNPLNQQMPRKFKIGLSGCEADCAQGMFHDLSLVAVRRGERAGFRMRAGGGLGHKPREAILVCEFIEERDVLPAMEALITMHNRYSDRTLRAKSRIKFLVERFGAQGFVERFNGEFARTRAALARAAHPHGVWRVAVPGPNPGPGAPRTFFAQRQPERFVVPIAVPLGRLASAQLRALAALMHEFALDDVRTTQDQNLMILGVPANRRAEFARRIGALGLAVPRTGDDVVACPGSSTCRLGITSSMVVAPKLDGGTSDLRIRVSGCHNGCAQPEAADIGLYGEGKRIGGKLIPHYQTYFGGNGMGGGALAIKGPSIPAARIEQAVERMARAFEDERANGERFFDWARRVGGQRFHALLTDLARVSPPEVAGLARDHGDEAQFRVVSLGGGECGAANDVAIAQAFFDAAHERSYREAFMFQRKPADALPCARAQLGLVGDALGTFLDPCAARELTSAAQALSSALDAAATDAPALGRVFADIDRWIAQAAGRCRARDPQLDLHDAVPRAAEPVRLVRKTESTSV